MLSVPEEDVEPDVNIQRTPNLSPCKHQNTDLTNHQNTDLTISTTRPGCSIL